MAKEATGIPVVVAGLGDVGRAIARAVLSSADLRARRRGRPGLRGTQKLDELVGTPTGLAVEADPARALPRRARRRAPPGHLVPLPRGASPPSSRRCARRPRVVSTCEELAYPWLAHEEEADALDALCEKNDVAVVGAGVNPGLALDRLPAFLSQGTGEVRRLEARRVVDLSSRREALWRKAGVGLTAGGVPAGRGGGRDRPRRAGRVGDAGGARLRPRPRRGGGGGRAGAGDAATWPARCRSQKGGVAGIRQVARGWQDGREVVRLELVLALGAEDPRDEVSIDADPPLRLVVPGGFPGEASTAWSVVHAAAAIPELQGLVTVLDLPPGRS